MTRKDAWTQGYAVVRRDHFPGHEHDPDQSSPPEIVGGEFSYTVKEVVLDVAEAEAEVDRLNELASPGVRYFWQGTHLFLDGGSHGREPHQGQPGRDSPSMA